MFRCANVSHLCIMAPAVSGTLNQAVYVLSDKYLGQAYFPLSVEAEK